MILPDPDETRTTLQSALDALKRGDRETAQRLARRAVALAPETEQPWLLLAVLSSPDRSLVYIKKALEINPENQTAQKALEWALSRHNGQPAAQQAGPLPEPAGPQPGEEIDRQAGADRPAQLAVIPALLQKISREISTRSFRLAALGLLVMVLIGEIVFLLQMMSRFLADPTPHMVCNSSLEIGKLYIEVQTLKSGPGGVLHYPSSYLYRAYWVEGTLANPVFLVSPAPDNQSLVASFGAGKTATLTWANCKTDSYRLSSPAAASLDRTTLPGPSPAQITIFFPTSAESQGLVIHGELLGQGH